MKPLIEIENLRKEFFLGSILSRDKIVAVDNISFKINPAEIFTLAGESGCGKTTVARMILGFEEPTAGRIIYSKESSDNKEPVWFTQGIQAIFQNPFETFNPLRKVEHYLFETVYNYKLAESQEKAREIINSKLESVGLSYEEVAGKYPSEFSGGQLQRISIARALLTDPGLLIADEPVSMVDASIRMSIVNLFKKLKEELQMSILYITHDLATAYYMSGQIAIMFRGHIMEMGPVEKVLMEPAHPYTKLLRESIPEADPAKKWTDRISISDLESDEYLRKGCKFAGRCPEAQDKCKEHTPEAAYIDDVFVKCHLYSG
ncbi:MAG: ABC transporter ATP-binding protein [Halanaerobiaceae bacterium]|nr:ABC transporter ATP-binding protein [Halanaerobiaceae bacterium]